ncbi:hypothetical protein GL218_06668 [Daldinia childiae]|uniref:uncharacterized protein n=1 Tax=Daldinia childiae TaxID=326645 RepID=UPI0014473A3F|nr:uncharacterized protein GL218_06668 [Daldinia childiae]KAF3056222.1 hypothetical protein GL218_06668 [Daldinia childiae]
MMTREHHRRRSPESSRRRRKERRDSREQLRNQQLALPAPPPEEEERNELIHLRSRAPSPLSSSSSTSSSLLNISRPSRRFGLGAFFGGGGGGRKQHRVKKKRSRFLRFGNSSSSSVGSDLAYGRGYVERQRSREFSPPSSSAGRPRPKRDQTDEEILELGRQFAEIARQQNAEDLKAAGRSRPSTLVGAAAALTQFRRTNSGNSNRGVGSSKPRRDDSSDDSEWESASEDESSSSEFDSGLAYGSSGLSLPNTINQPIPRQSTPSSSRSPRPSQVSIYGPPLRRKSSVVDPSLFGPVNSLRGYVEAPCGFETVDRSTVVGSPRPYEPSITPTITPSEATPDNRPLQLVYPAPTSDPKRFDVYNGPVVSSQQDLSAPPRPAPVPIQHPRPIVQVPRRVLDSVETGSGYSEHVSSKKVPEDTVVVPGSDRKDDHNKLEEKRDRDNERRPKRSDAGVQARKGEERKSHDNVPPARNDLTEVPRETRFGNGLEFKRDWHYREKIVPELKRKSEEEGRRRDEHDDDSSDHDLTRNKRKIDPEDERKIIREETYEKERRGRDGANRSSVGSYQPVNGPEYPMREGPIDPFQYQVADDAFQTPPYTTPKRPLTPNVITVDREPNFSPERLSRKDSYERELRDAHEIYQTAEHATAPISGVAFAAAAAAVMAEDRRGRSHSRGGDASSRNRSRRDESPKREKDAVQEDADRYYREAELARRIKDAEIRDAESSVVGKWKQDQQPVIVDVVSPPEMDHAKKKSAYDAPDADVRIDNVLEHPNELSRFRTLDIKGLTRIPVFTARDPSAERERPMLNIVRPTPVPTPIPEGQRHAEEPLPKLVRKIDIPPPKVVSDVVTESRSEVAPAPLIAKSVSWGENQTKRYVVESPEREDDPYSGTKIVTPAKPPRSRAGRKSSWGLASIAAALGGGGSNKNASSSTSGQTAVVEATEPKKASRNGDEPANRRASVPFKSTYDSPPIPGPKPSNLKGAQMPGSFAEDPVFTANIAAALEGSGFDPNIVINDASFHKRDSPPGPNDFSVYQAPFVESVADLGTVDGSGTTTSQGVREHGFVIGEVETPPDERDISTDKSRILPELNSVEQRKQDKALERDSAERPHAIVDGSEAIRLSRSNTEDDWDVLSNEFSKKERKKREKAARAQTLDDTLIGNKARNEQNLEAEFFAEGEDSSPKKRSKKSKKAVVVQEDSRQPDIVESPKVVALVDGIRDVQNVNTVQIDTLDRLDESNKRSKRDLEIYNSPSIPTPKPDTSKNGPRGPGGADIFFTPDDESGSSRKDSWRARRDSGGSFSRTVLPSELSTASSYGIIDTADSIIETEEEWDTPKKSKRKSKRDSGAYDSPPRSVPILEAAPDLVQKVDVTSLPKSEQGTLRKGKKSKSGSVDDEFAFPTVRGLEGWDSFNESKNKSTQDASAHDSLPRVALPVEDLYDSPKEMIESASDIRSEKTAAAEEELDTPRKSRKSKKSTRSSIPYEDRPSTPQSVAPSEASVGSSKRSKRDSYPDPLSTPSRSAPASDAGTDDSRKKSKKKRNVPANLPENENDLTEGGPSDKGKGRSKILDYDADSVVPNQARYDDSQPTSNQTRDDKADQAKAVTSTPSSAGKKDRKGSTSFFGRLKSSIGIVEEKEPLRKLDEDKNDPFLGNAGILGAGVGSTGDAIMSQEPQPNATNAPLDEESQTVPFIPQRQSTLSREAELIDPEIIPREIRPAIDPKHGDLLPLPPSRSVSPLSKLGDDFPPLPDSRPETPENERHSREAPTHTRRRSTLETPTRPKTPSQSAIPIQFFRPGHRHTPSNGRSSPSVSPITATVEFGSESKNRSRPASWEASRDFKPLLLLQRALRGSIDLSNSPERESSPSGSELRERGSPSSAHLILESPDRDHPFRDNIFSGPLSSPAVISAEKPESSHAVEKALQLDEDAFRQLPSEASFHRNSRADGSHLSPLPEESDLKLAEDDSHSPFSSPTFLVAPSIGDRGDSIQGLLKDNLEDSVVSTEAAMPIIGEPEITITSDDRSLSQANEAVVSTGTPHEFLPVSDFFPGSKTPDSIDTFDTALSNAGDHRPLESSGFLDNGQDDDKIQERGLSDIDELLMGSTNTKATPLQDEILGGIAYERISPAGQVESVPAITSTKDALKALEEDLDDNKSIETLAPESSISEVHEEQPSIEVQEPDSDASTISQSTSTTLNKSKKKKNRKSQSAELSLESPLITTDTRNVELDELPLHRAGDAVPVYSNLIPTEKLPLVEEKPAIVEELAFGHEEPAIPESKTPEVEVDSPKIELQVEPEPAPIPLDIAAVEKPTAPESEIAIHPEVSNIELGVPSTNPERSVVELETTATEPEISSTEPIATPEPVLPSGEASTVETKLNAGETRIEEPETSTVQKDVPATEAELTGVKPETPNAELEPVAKLELTTVGSETPTIQAEPTIIGVESASEQESALPNAELEKPEQLETTLELSPSASEKDEKKEEDIQRPLLENEEAEPVTSVEEPTKEAEELTQETSVESPRALPVGPQISSQDQPEATSPEPRDGQLDSPEEIPTIETSENEENKTQTTVPEPEDQVVDEQISAQEEEGQPLSKSPPLPIVQAEDQQPDTPVEGFAEAPASLIQTEQQPNIFPENQSISEQVLQEEPTRPSDANWDNEKTSRETLSPNQPMEPILSNPAVDSHDDFQSTVPVLGQDEQPQSASKSVLEETHSPDDSIKLAVPIVDGEQHDEQPTLTETNLQRSIEQASNGSTLLKDTNVDESSPQLDILSGEDTRDQQGPAPTDLTEVPLSKPDWSESSEDKQDKSTVPFQAVEEAPSLFPETDEAQPPSLPNEVINEEARETTRLLDEPGSEKGESKEMSQDVSEVVDASALTGPNPEPAPQPTPFEADVNELQVVSDVPKQPSQDRDNELDASLTKVQSVPQSIVEDAQKPVVEQAEPTADIVLSEPDTSSKESQNKSEESQVDTTDAIDAPALSGELESKESEESNKSVGEPMIVETNIDSKPPPYSPAPAPEVDKVDVTAVTQVENQAPESESTPSKEEEDEEKRGPIQVETVTNNIPQETPEILDARVDADKEVTSPTQLTTDRISDDAQAVQAKEDTDGKPENISTDTKETSASVILSEIPTEPVVVSEDTAQTGESLGLDLNPPSIERSEKDEEKPQSAQFPGPLEQGAMETSPEPVGETPAPGTIFNPDWASIDLPPPPDYLPESEVHSQEASGSFGDVSKAQQEPSQDQPIDPLDQLIQHIEAKTKSNTLDDLRDGPDLKDSDVAAGTQEQAPQEDAEVSMEAQNSLLAEGASKGERDIVQQPSGEIVPAVQESANDNLPTEADAAQEPSTRDESQTIPVLPAQDTLPTEPTPTAVLEPQDNIEQSSESMTNDSVLAISQVGEPTRAMPTCSEDDLSNPLTEHTTLSDSQAESNLLAEDKTQSTMEILPTIAEEGESEDQDALDSTIGAVAPITEPSTEVPSSDLIEMPSTISQDQTNLGEAASETPVISEPVESVSQPHQDDPQSPINKDKGKEKEISQVQEREPESSPLPIEPPTEQTQSPTPESSQPQDVMPLDSPLVQEIKTEPHLTEQDPPDLSDLPTPGTSKTATSTLDISPSPTKEAEPRASDVTGTTVHSQDSEQEPGVHTDKAGDDMLIIRPEIAPSGEVTNVQDQEKTRQTNDLTENAMLEEEPVAEPVRDDESLENVVTPRPKKSKKGKKRGSQPILDDAASIPSQETTESAPSMPAAVDETINPTKSTMPIISEELYLTPSDRVDELTETATTIVQQDDSRSPTNSQSPEANVKEIAEQESKSSESVSIEDKEGEENKQLTLLDDNLSEQIPEQAAKESPVVLFTDEQSEIQASASTETSKEEKLDEPVSPRKNKKGKKAKGGNSHDENVSAPQVEPSQVSMGAIDNHEETDIGRSTPQQSPEGADIIDLGSAESKDIEIKDVGRSDDVQSQEQNQAEFESATQLGISEIAETENLTLESLKDEKVEEAAPTKKGKKNKKKKRASLRKDETISQQESAQLTSDLATGTSAIEQVNTEKLSVSENPAEQGAADLTPGQKDDGEKKPCTQEPELEAEVLPEPEPDSILQQPESPMEVRSTNISPDVPPMSIEDTIPIEENYLSSLPEVPAEFTSIEEAPVVNTEDNKPSAEENILTVVPPQIVEEQVERDTLLEPDIPLSDQTPPENIATIPTSEDLNPEDTAQSVVVQSEIVSQTPEEQTNVVSSIPPREEPLPQGLVQSDEKHEETVDPIASETPAEVVQLDEFSRSGEDLQPAESTQLEAAVSGEPMQTQDLPTQEPAQLEEPIATEEPLNQELPKPEELTQPGESEQLVSVPQDLLEVEAPAQENSVQPEESTQRSGLELLAQAEEPTQLESSETPIQELPATLDETESMLTKKSKKSKGKKSVNQAEPEPASESTQLAETQTQKELPKRSREQHVDQRAEQRASWGFFGGLTDSFKSLLSIQEPMTTSKDNKNTEDLPEMPTKSESKPEEKEASQLETEPTLKTVPSSEPIEQSQHLDSQLIVDDTSTITTDAVPEDVLPEVATSKKPKKKKKKASQVSQEPESSATAPPESQAQPILPEGSPIQESQEQLDTPPKVEHTTAPRGEEKSREDPSQSSGSKMSKKERRKMKKLAALAAELFQPEPDLKAKDEPVVPKTVSGPSEPPTELVNSNSEVQNAPITTTTSTSVQEESLQSPTVEAESSTQPIQGHVGDLAEKIGEEIGETSRDVQESKKALADIPVEDLEKEKEALILNTLEPGTEIPNSDPQSQSLPDVEKQDETAVITEPLISEEQLPTESNDISELVKTPKISATEQQELPINEQLDTDPSTPKEPEPQPSPVSRKKSKKDKKKKRMNAQTGLEIGSGTQTPVSQEPNTSHNSSDVIAGEPTAQGPERTMVNEGEWPEFPNNPPQDETRRKASGTSTPLESIEDALANASPDTVAKENAPRRLTPENISEVEGQGSKAKDVEEGIPPKPKDQDQNAENINISHPDENSVEVPGITQPPSPVSERHPGKGPLSETRQDILDHVELPEPVTPPRTPSTVAAHPVNVDLSPAQLSSHIEHERPFDQSPQPGKRIRTYLSSGDPTISELSPTQLKFPRNTESSSYDARGLLPPAGSYIAETSDNNVVSHDITPAREIAVSYFESQLITKAKNSHNVEENSGVKKISTSGLLPVLTPQREIAASYFERQPSNEIQPRDDTPEDTTGEHVFNAPQVAMGENMSTSPAESQLSQLDPRHVEKESLSAQPEARQPSPIQDTTTPARKIAAILMESHFHSSKNAKMHKDTDSPVPEITPAAPSTGEAAHLTEKYANMKTPNTQDILDNRVVSEISEPKALEDRHPEVNFRPESPGGRNFRSGSNTPPLALRRTGKRMSGDLRSLSSNLSNNNNASRENLHQTQQLQQTTIPVANEGRVRAKDMTDVYDGYGEGRIGSPRSPTRPQSMRRRQSIQVLELESRVEQLVAENRALADEKAHVEQNITHRTASAVTERDAEIESLKASLEWLHKEVNRLTEVNEGLHSANNVLAHQHNEKYKRLESQHASAAKELERSHLAQDNYDRTIQEKDSEIQELRAQLEVTKEQVREMQRQILAHKPPDADFLRLKDEDHFDHRCQQLCQHVQQWVLRFSKFSDMRACRLTNEINDEKIIDRLDNAVLDGSDVDQYLSDRVRRRDIFMSMTMNMIWEFVFTRYLFGMDREHRQKLKSLEKLLLEVGPPHAVRQWRAVTLTLLSKRPAFGDQRNQDTEAVVQAVFQTLCMILPPPSNLEAQIQSQLRRVMREAVDLSIEMRTQRAEYMMLPPLQPEYDANGDLARTVAFNAALMNERSGDSIPNDQYEVQRAIVRTVLFPLVVKKGDDNGVGDEEVVICPAQVLVAKPPRHATIRIVTPTSDTGGPLSRGATPSAAAPSTVSLQMQDAPLPMPTPPQEAEYLEGGI